MLTGTRSTNQASLAFEKDKPLENDKQLTGNSHGWSTMVQHPLPKPYRRISAGDELHCRRNNGTQTTVDRDASLYMQNKYHNFPTMMSLARKVVEILNKTKLY